MWTRLSRSKVITGVLLGCALVAVYMAIYQGQLFVSDERTLFDSAQSLVRRGDTFPTYEFNLAQDVQPDFPWESAAHEPLPIALTALFTLIGRVSPEIGMIHTGLLSNIVVTALTAVSLYWIGTRLGYSARSALLVALVFGVATNAAPYTRTLFREPLMALFTLWGFAFALFVRRDWLASGQIPWRGVTLLVVAVIGAVLTKVMAVLLIPGLLVILLPASGSLVRHRRLRLFALVGTVILIALIVIVSLSPLVEGTRYEWSRWTQFLETASLTAVVESLLGYQISVGRSIWLYSPVLLVALWGAYRLVRQGEWQIVVVPLVMIPVFSLFYGVVHQVEWWGGWGWGPRYFVPLLPVMMLWLLPIFEERLHLPARIGVGVIIAFSVAMQVLALTTPIPNYYTERHLSGDAVFGDPQYWMPINWEWSSGPIAYHLTQVGTFDVAWAYVMHGALLAILLGVGALIVALAVWRKTGWIVVSGAVGVTLIATGFGMYALRDDPRYVRDNADMNALVAQLNTESGVRDAVFIDDPGDAMVFMNWLKTPALTATLDYAPALESGESPALPNTQAIVDQMGEGNLFALEWTAERYDRLWLVTNTDPFDTSRTRAIEWYLVSRYYVMDAISTAPDARAIPFYTGAGPVGDPTATVGVIFGEYIRLNGYNMPLGETYTPGDVLPVMLFWDMFGTPPLDYNVGLYLLAPDGAVVLQRDGQPQAGFGRFTQWETETAYRDNYALQLPQDLPVGEYRLVVAVYDWQTGSRLLINNDVDSITIGTINIER